jgi:hypothetical protein
VIDLGINPYVCPEAESVAVFSYPQPWCGCSVQRGAGVHINGRSHFVLGSYVGPIESPGDLAREIAERWGVEIATGNLLEGGPWAVALLIQQGEGPGIEHECAGHWRMHVGWR